MTDDRRYDDREVGLILKRVAELHESDGDGADARAMTRGEIEEVVNELGISKALVARAVSEISVHDVRNRPVWFLGGKSEMMFEEVVPGHFDEATLTLILEVLRRHLGDPGELKTEGGARIWNTTERSNRSVHFTVVRHDSTTTLRLEERMRSEAGGTVGGLGVAGGFLGFLMMVPLKALVAKSVLLLAMGPLAAGGATLGWSGGRAIWKRRSATREVALRTTFGEILSLAKPAPPQLTEG